MKLSLHEEALKEAEKHIAWYLERSEQAAVQLGERINFAFLEIVETPLFFASGVAAKSWQHSPPAHPKLPYFGHLPNPGRRGVCHCNCPYIAATGVLAFAIT